MSRTRLIRPEFFTDELMASASIPTRFVYIGLWTLCDDAGYFENKPRQIAAALLPYDGPAHRQKVVDRALADLAGMERISILNCGVHGLVPTLAKHGQKGGNKAFTFRERHLGGCSGRKADPVPKLETKGKTVSLAVKRAVYARDQGLCRYCGHDGSKHPLVFDHLDNFGSGSMSNVVLACGSCNRKKGHSTPEEAGLTLSPEPSAPSTYSQSGGTSESSSESVSGSSSVSVSAERGASAPGGRLPPYSSIVGGKAS